MLGVEMMLSNMIGMKPDELKACVDGVIRTINSAAENIKQINARLERIENHLGVTNNDGSRNGNTLPATCHSERITL